MRLRNKIHLFDDLALKTRKWHGRQQWTIQVAFHYLKTLSCTQQIFLQIFMTEIWHQLCICICQQIWEVDMLNTKSSGAKRLVPPEVLQAQSCKHRAQRLSTFAFPKASKSGSMYTQWLTGCTESTVVLQKPQWDMKKLPHLRLQLSTKWTQARIKGTGNSISPSVSHLHVKQKTPGADQSTCSIIGTCQPQVDYENLHWNGQQEGGIGNDTQ